MTEAFATERYREAGPKDPVEPAFPRWMARSEVPLPTSVWERPAEREGEWRERDERRAYARRRVGGPEGLVEARRAGAMTEAIAADLGTAGRTP